MLQAIFTEKNILVMQYESKKQTNKQSKTKQNKTQLTKTTYR